MRSRRGALPAGGPATGHRLLPGGLQAWRVIRGRAGSQTTEEARGAVIGNAEQVTESPHQRAVVSAGTVDGVAGAGTRQRRWTKVGMRVTGQLPAIVNEGNAV